MAATRYTAGKNPYGYKRLGDLMVFLFFGIIGVCATSFILSGTWHWLALLPASAVGFLCVSVLNLNNLRDIESDRKAGKKTIAGFLGIKKTKVYHILLVVSAFVCVFLFLNKTTNVPLTSFMVLITLPFFLALCYRVWKTKVLQKIDALMKPQALLSLLFCFLFGCGLWMLG